MNQELKYLEVISLSADLEFNMVLNNWTDRFDRNNDTPVLQLFRFCLDARNKEYTLAKQSLKSVVTEY